MTSCNSENNQHKGLSIDMLVFLVLIILSSSFTMYMIYIEEPVSEDSNQTSISCEDFNKNYQELISKENTVVLHLPKEKNDYIYVIDASSSREAFGPIIMDEDVEKPCSSDWIQIEKDPSSIESVVN